MASSSGDDLIVRHFRQIIVWPLQLMPLRPGDQIQRHWKALEAIAGGPWSEVIDEFCADPGEFQERHYKEFVTFLPYVQRFLYQSRAGQETAANHGEASLRVYRRHDVAQARVRFAATDEPITFNVAHVDLYFFLDADIAILAFEMYTDDIPVWHALNATFRFGRAYPAYWEPNGEGGNCPHKVEWLSGSGQVLSVSDFEVRSKYLSFVARNRTACLARHWEFLLQPLALEYPGQTQTLRYRQLEYYQMPFMSYLALDDPAALTRADFVRLALVARPGDHATLPYSAGTLENFEKDFCDDRFWGRSGDQPSRDTRIIVTGHTLSVVGPHADAFFSDADTGLLGQFRHQYFLLFLVAHFHKAALLSMSDELAVAMNRLVVGEARSVRAFKRTIRQMMEVFLRFTHRYWFHEVSSQAIARDLFARLTRHLDNEALYQEVRSEVTDMNQYLDSDSARRQANTILRLTVVTIVGLIGTVATGILGMNIFAEADKPAGERIAVFVLAVAATIALTVWSVVRSKRLADLLDLLSDTRMGWKGKWRGMRQIWREPL
jgi:CorA-like Mg2+ transporter protein